MPATVVSLVGDADAPLGRDLPIQRRRTGWVVVAAAMAASVAAIAISVRSRSIALYGDARAHLDIARQLTDSVKPGFTQLGSGWLPLPHLLMAPFAISGYLWHSALAGAIVGGVCFCYTAFRVWSVIYLVTSDRAAAWVGFFIYASNINVLYVQTTALTEPVLLATVVGAAYHLTRWVQDRSLQDFVWSALLTFAATLTHYDGAALLLAELAGVALVTRRQQRYEREPEGHLVLFAMLGGSGIGLWLLYNLLIFHNPLYFLDGAGAQQTVAAERVTEGSLTGTVHVYGWALMDLCGPLVLAFALVGCVALLINSANDRLQLFLLALLAAPVAANLAGLLVGRSDLSVPQVAPYTLSNVHGGLVAVPFVAVAAAIAVARWRWITIPALAVVAAGAVILALSTPITLREARSSLGPVTAVARLLHQRYQGGEILADDSYTAPVIFGSGLDLRDFITRDTPKYREALQQPGLYVTWVLEDRADAISAERVAHPGRFRQFSVVASIGQYTLMRDAASPTAGR